MMEIYEGHQMADSCTVVNADHVALMVIKCRQIRAEVRNGVRYRVERYRKGEGESGIRGSGRVRGILSILSSTDLRWEERNAGFGLVIMMKDSEFQSHNTGMRWRKMTREGLKLERGVMGQGSPIWTEV
jgi:hypothetical protein